MTLSAFLGGPALDTAFTDGEPPRYFSERIVTFLDGTNDLLAKVHRIRLH
jgi:hypothetical protein